MKKTEEKTNALRLLDAQGVAHQTHSYDPDAVDGEAVAALTGIEPDRVFKTLVTVGASRRYYVFDVPVNISAVLGKSHMSVAQLLQLNKGSVLELDRKVGEAIDIFVNNRLVARGEVVVVEDRLGVTMTEIIKTEDSGA